MVCKALAAGRGPEHAGLLVYSHVLEQGDLEDAMLEVTTRWQHEALVPGSASKEKALLRFRTNPCCGELLEAAG